MTVIETSKLLNAVAVWHEGYADMITQKILTGDADFHLRMAAAVRSVIIPEPINETMKEHEKIEQHITCSACGLIARIKYGSMEDVRPVSLRCSCGAITPYENQKD